MNPTLFFPASLAFLLLSSPSCQRVACVTDSSVHLFYISVPPSRSFPLPRMPSSPLSVTLSSSLTQPAPSLFVTLPVSSLFLSFPLTFPCPFPFPLSFSRFPLPLSLSRSLPPLPIPVTLACCHLSLPLYDRSLHSPSSPASESS